jgi:hypothetical protein
VGTSPKIKKANKIESIGFIKLAKSSFAEVAFSPANQQSLPITKILA